MRFALCLTAVAFIGCAAQPQPQGVLIVGDMPRIEDPLAEPVVDETPAETKPVDPLAVPVADDLPPAKPVKTVIDILDESPSAARTPPAKAKPAPLPAADAPTVDGNYYEAPRRRGIFRRSGSTNNGSAAAFC